MWFQFYFTGGKFLTILCSLSTDGATGCIWTYRELKWRFTGVQITGLLGLRMTLLSVKGCSSSYFCILSMELPWGICMIATVIPAIISAAKSFLTLYSCITFIIGIYDVSICWKLDLEHEHFDTSCRVRSNKSKISKIWLRYVTEGHSVSSFL